MFRLSACLRRTQAATFLLALLLLMPSLMFAQFTGTITGTVQDTTGAVVPEASITLINEATKDTRQTVSNNEGYFTFAGIVPGTYSVKAEAKGFKSWMVSGIGILPGDKKNFGASLVVGATGESVTVEAISSAVQIVDSGERSAVLTAKDIKNLSLQGRDVTELVKVLPGFNNYTGSGGLANQSGYDPTVAGIGSAVGNGYSANGTPNRGGTDLVSDGAHVIDPGCNCSATQSVNADMVSEVKVQTSNFGAESAKGPVVIQAVGKSGGSTYHGETYLHFRDSSMNSADWLINNRDLDKPRDRYWYPGGNFGGPVPFTKKAFFWSGFEYYNQIFPDREPILRAVVPTMGMRQGNFSSAGEGNSQLCSLGGWLPQCSLTGHMPDGTAVPANGIIPQSAFDPGGLAIMSMIPLPNADPATNGGFNFTKSQTTSRNGFQLRNRVDYNFSDNTKLNVSYNLQNESSIIPVMLWWQPPQSVPYPGQPAQKGKSHTVSANFLHVFSPTLTNEFIGTMSYFSNPGVYQNPDGVSRAALGYPYKGVFKNGVDVMPSVSNAWWIPGYPMLYQADMSHYESVKFLPTISDNLTKVFSKHTFKAGFYWELTGNKQGTVDWQNGLVEFAPMDWAPNATGNPVANILLGMASHYKEVNQNTVTDMAYSSLSFYVQDSWKATSRLTLDLGLRFEHSPSWTDRTGETGLATWTKAAYDADVAAGNNLLGIRWHGIDGAVPLAGRDVKPIFVSPRFGLAYDVFGKGNTMLRGGFGAYRWRDQYNDYAGALSTALGTVTYETWSPTQLGSLENVTPPVASVNFNGSSVYAVDPTDDTQPVTYTYNFTISQKIPGNSLLEVAYVGNQSTDMMNSPLNQNIIPLGAYFRPDPVDGVTYTPNDADQRKGDYRPYKFNELNIYRHGAYANYNALQVSWSKPQGSLTYGLNYTFSKALGIQGKADPINLDANYGVLNIDRTHAFNASYSYDFGNRFHGNPVLGTILNGWMLSGITTIQSGPNLQAAYDKGFRITGPQGVSGAIEVNAKNILGTSDYTLIPMLTCDPSDGPNGIAVNGSCFALPVAGGNQNGPINMPYMRGPAYLNNDLTAQKTFSITERQKIQFRMSAFNFLNHPLASFDNNEDPNIRATFDENGRFAAPTTSGNTRITYGVPYLKHGRRVVEMTLRYVF